MLKLRETEQTLNKMNNHWSYVMNNARYKPMAIHLNSPGYSIDQLRKKDTALQKIRGNRWLTILDTRWPKGLNLRTDT